MTKVIALLALTVLAIGLMLGNYWFTFGLWPQSWLAFMLFAAGSLVVSGLMQAVVRSDD